MKHKTWRLSSGDLMMLGWFSLCVSDRTFGRSTCLEFVINLEQKHISFTGKKRSQRKASRIVTQSPTTSYVTYAAGLVVPELEYTDTNVYIFGRKSVVSTALFIINSIITAAAATTTR